MESNQQGARFQIGWHLLAWSWLALVPTQLRFGPLWEVPPSMVPFIIGTLCAYAGGALALTLIGMGAGRVSRTHLGIATLATLLAYLLFLLLTDVLYPRSLLLAIVPIAALFLWWSVRAPRFLRVPSLVVLAVSCILALGAGIEGATPEGPIEEVAVIQTAHEALAATHYLNRFRNLEATGGAISVFRDRYLLATGGGALSLLDFDHAARTLEVTELPRAIPLNREDFLSAAASQPEYLFRWFRVMDILVQDLGDSFRLFASHHYWRPGEACAVVRISVVEARYAEIETGFENAPWRTLFESEPCVPLRTPNPEDPDDHAFAGHLDGGRMALVDAGSLLLTVGDHGFDGVYGPKMFSQDPAVSWGKTILIDIESGSADWFTLGHRNALGLYRTPEGELWLTESGPVGGDELNLLRAGLNYGWPLATYGSKYGGGAWPLVDPADPHQGFEAPVFTWVPSIAPSAVLRVEGDMFSGWDGNLIVASLRDQSLWRIVVEEDRTILTERISLGRRIRDVVEGPDGGLVLWQEVDVAGELRGTISTIRSASEAGAALPRGELLFAACTGCHVPHESGSSGIAPPLEGIFGRDIASVESFPYSEALRLRSGSWNEERLDQFLESPQSFAPGTMMLFDGLADPRQRAAMIEQLRTLR